MIIYIPLKPCPLRSLLIILRVFSFTPPKVMWSLMNPRRRGSNSWFRITTPQVEIGTYAVFTVHSARIPISKIQELIHQDDVEIPGESASSDGIMEEPSSRSLWQKGHLWMHLDEDEGKYSSHGIILDQILSKHFDNGDHDLDDLDQDDPDPQIHDLHN